MSECVICGNAITPEQDARDFDGEDDGAWVHRLCFNDGPGGRYRDSYIVYGDAFADGYRRAMQSLGGRQS